MNLNDPTLVAKYGSWVRVQVEFYDFLFESASKLCTTHWNQSAMMNALEGGFEDGNDFYETTVKAIEDEFPDVEDAWERFVKAEK